MKITSYGGAGEVTGSKHLVEVNGMRILMDCGMFQGRRGDSDRKNRDLGFDGSTVDAAILSHAHIDHSGLLPMLAKRGFRGNVYTTHATRDLCSIMLLDSAHIQKRDAEWLSKKKMTHIAPLYTAEDVQEIMRHFVCVPYEITLPLGNDVTLTFHDAGHVLGSAMIELACVEDGKQRRVVFSGDIGRKNMPILQDPWEPDDADIVLMESTYGDRDHDPIEQLDEKFGHVIRETIARGGKVIIPTFALERAQEVIYALKRLQMHKAIPDAPVFVDSPLTVNITEIFRLHTEGFDQEFRETMAAAGDPFQLNSIRYIRDRDQSMELNKKKEPAIILSASGMCEFGRIVHHLRNNCTDKRNTILIVGFQAKHTLGRKIVERQRHIKIFGVEHELNAQVVVMNEFSAHAGRGELIEFGARFKDRADKVFLVHGEEKAIEALQGSIQERGVGGVDVLEAGKSVEV